MWMRTVQGLSVSCFALIFRQAALKAAAVMPVLNKEPLRAALQPRPKYPNVFDSQSQAQQSSGKPPVDLLCSFSYLICDLTNPSAL